jgi:hypothetical protein
MTARFLSGAPVSKIAVPAEVPLIFVNAQSETRGHAERLQQGSPALPINADTALDADAQRARDLNP